ncbi:Uncharacterised protein [Streptococcus agalactiae]|nr:Uncharacterised protein [Streptococcus agalactiae]
MNNDNISSLIVLTVYINNKAGKFSSLIIYGNIFAALIAAS